MAFYAQVSNDYICIVVSDLNGIVDAPDMIPIDTLEHGLLGKRYVNGKWIDVQPELSDEPKGV